MWMTGISIEEGSGEPLSGVDRVVYIVQSVLVRRVSAEDHDKK